MSDGQLLDLDGRPDEQLVWIEGELGVAIEVGLLRPLPTRQEDFVTAGVEPGQLAALRDRLHRLGYLSDSSGPDTVNDRLRSALKRFQREAGLTADGWLGTQTWQGLQELFAFEPVTDLARWFDGDEMTDALRRAAHLRLSVLGLTDWDPAEGPGRLEGDLARWAHVLHAIGASVPSPGQAGATRSLVMWMFDLDRLVEHATLHRARVRNAMESGPRASQQLVIRVLNCLVQIELWLLGYDALELDGKPARVARSRRKNRLYRYSPMYRAMRSFWKDQGIGTTHDKKSHRLLLRTLASLGALGAEAEGDAIDRRERSRVLVAQIEMSSGPELAAEWRRTATLGRIWDGARRLYRFLSGLFRRAVRKIALVVRAAYQAAAEAFSVVGRAIRNFGDSVDFLLRQELRGSNKYIAMQREKDFDFNVFVERAAPREDVIAFLNLVRTRLIRLHRTIRILKLLLAAAILAAKGAAGPVGWGSAVRTLIYVYGELTEDDITEMRQPILA